jgi:hypothetical protein
MYPADLSFADIQVYLQHPKIIFTLDLVSFHGGVLPCSTVHASATIPRERRRGDDVRRLLQDIVDGAIQWRR